jgi:cold shock CspA family protein
MATGTVKYFNIQSGKGMLTQDGGADVPFDYTALISVGGDQLRSGQSVEFAIEPSWEGIATARDIRLIGSSPTRVDLRDEAGDQL